MMARIIQFALVQRLLVILAVLLMAGFGAMAVKTIAIDAFPDVSPPQVKVIIKAPGMTPEEVETRITTPIEIELLGVPKQTMLRSIVKYALTDITIDFKEGTDIYWARQQIAEKLNGIWQSLPDGIEGGIAPVTTPLGEVFRFTVEGGNLSLMEKRSLLDWTIRPALRTVQGVADVNTMGGSVRSFEVIPDIRRMSARGISTQMLIEALNTNNRNDGAGRLSEGEESLLVRAEGRIQNLQDVKAIVVHNETGVAITVADIAEVHIGALTRYGAVSQNGREEAIEGLVLALRGANAREVVEGVKLKIEELKSAMPEGVNIDVYYNRSQLVDHAVHTVKKALMEAVILVLVLLMLFLGDWRAALTVASVLPLAVLFAFILMKQFGLSANLMSLGGLAIAIGMLVDAAVVVVENIASMLAEEDKRLPRLHLIYRAVCDVGTPVISGILIIIIVFLPLLTLQGLEGKLFSPVALSIVFALSGSLILSLTAIPVLASFLLKKTTHGEPWLPRKLQAIYQPILIGCIAHSRIVLIVAGILLLLTASVYTQIGKTFMPTLDEGDIILQVEKLPSINLDQAVHIDQRIQKAILENVPEVTRIVSRAGSDEIGLDPMGLNESDHLLVLKSQDEWRMKHREELIHEIHKIVETIPGIAFSFNQPIQSRVAEMLTGVKGDVAIKIYGPETGVLIEKAGEVAATLRKVQGATDVFTARNSGMQYLQVKIDRLAAGRLGLNIDSLEHMLRAQIEGLKLGIVQEGIKRTPLLLRGSGDTASFSNTLITLPDGQRVPLSAIAVIDRVEGFVSIARERGQRFSVVRSNVEGRDLVGFVADARQAVEQQVQLPPGYFIQWGGEFENQQRASARLAQVIPLAIGLIFLLLFSTFKSIKQALLVLSNIPLAMIGGVFALWISGEYLSVPASVGFIALLGIAVLNGVVMLSYFNQLKALGMEIGQIVITGSLRRLRPVMMTASIAAFGLIPLLFATGPGSEIQRPLAVVVIGGLVTSTLLTLIILPIIYKRFG